jgi:hypothetical protein
LNAKLQELGASASGSLQFLTHSIQTACFPERVRARRKTAIGETIERFFEQ